MTMGIRKTPGEDWLVLDNLYEREQKLRRDLIANQRNDVLQYLPGSEEACKGYPSQFQYPGDDQNYICNLITNKTFRVAAPLEQHPLEIAANLIMEDMNLITQGDNDTECYL